MKVRASRTYSASANNYFISKEYDCTVIPVKGMCFIDSGLTESGVIEPVEIIEGLCCTNLAYKVYSVL
ncbi:hypothetical protein [Acinetobacter pittii]|uniref:hypothetical protein n=1 Tax=Acinetobacter pittii TaxID=48296 RepID=UPI003BAB9864